jgi:PPOX class probable F420-dependent enzyme
MGDVRDFLEAPCYMRLATLMPDGAPQITVLWYRLAEDALHIICPESAQKVKNLDIDDRAAAVIEAPDSAHRYVELRGPCQVIRDDTLARRELRLIARRYIGGDADGFVDQLSPDPRVVLKLTPTQVRGYGIG